MIDKAREFAVDAHGDQRYGDHPYARHLDSVAALAAPYGETAQAVAYLHDVVEDTAVGLQEIRSVFGELVAACVEVLTDGPGADREARKRDAYRKMRGVSGDLELALIVKTADRLANVTACIRDGRADKLRMYRAEQAGFRAAVYRKSLCETLWSKLEEALDDAQTT